MPNYVSTMIKYFFVGRLLGCPKKWDFLKNGMNMVDVLAIMPYYVELLMSQQALLLFLIVTVERLLL